MRLVSRGKVISGIVCNSISDSEGKLLLAPTQLIFTDTTPVTLVSFSYNKELSRYEAVFSNAITNVVGDNIILYSDTYSYTSVIAKISNDAKTIQLPTHFKLPEDVITKVSFEKGFTLVASTVEEGLYYTDTGVLLFVADKFDYDSLVSLEDIRINNPILREERATEDWELVQIKRNAINNVFLKLSNYGDSSIDKYNYLNGDVLKRLILLQVTMEYLETLPLDITGKNSKLELKIQQFDEVLRNWIHTYTIDNNKAVSNKEELLLLKY